jgi:outer membrane lipopolysaccharide assembly protein LptE/RlpB
MKKVILLVFTVLILSACNFKENLKETGDAVQHGAQNAAEAVKQLPAEISEASNKLEAEIRE